MQSSNEMSIGLAPEADRSLDAANASVSFSDMLSSALKVCDGPSRLALAHRTFWFLQALLLCRLV